LTSISRSLPPRPQPPEGYDCCGGGCADCDLRRYYADLAEWMKQLAEIEAGPAL